MARIINIPLAFEFRPLRAKWGVRTVEIQGWTKEFRKRGLYRPIDTSDNVKVEILELGKTGGLAGLYGMLGASLDASKLKHPAVIHWSDIPVEIKVAATPTKSMEEIRGRRFDILVCGSREGDYWRTGDAWAMRREFLSLKNDLFALLDFLRKWGEWDQKGISASEVASVVFPEGIWELQQQYRTALLSPPDEWLCKGIDPFKGAYATPMYPHFILEHTECKLAIEATITIDLLRKVKFRKCRRPDCSEVFPLESEHKRLYCSQPCAHLESVRKQRRTAARQKKKEKSKKGP